MSSHQICPHGHPVSPGTSFCGTCGAQLSVPPPPGPPSSGVNRTAVAVILGTVALVVLLVVTIVVVVATRSGSSSTTADEGDITVLIGLAGTEDCDYTARFFEGGDVVLLDSQGQEIGRTIIAGDAELGNDLEEGERWPGCYWTLTFKDPPESGTYSIDYDMPGGVIGGRDYEIEGRVTMTVRELEAADWQFDIRLST